MKFDIKLLEKHVPEQDLEAAVTECLVCGNTSARKFVFSIQKDPNIDLLHCPQCRAYSASRMPTAAYLQEYYSTYYTSLLDGEEEHKVTMEDIDKFAKHLMRYIPINKQEQRLSILDFGGGDGTISRKFAEEVLKIYPDLEIEISVVDFNSDLEISTPQLKVISHHLLSDVENQSFDIVLASAIIEHIPEAGKILDELLAKVKSGGYFYARTPSSVPIMKLSRAYPLLFPMHVHDMGSAYWNRVLDRSPIKAEVIASQPSVVMTSFQKHFVRTLAAYVLKAVAYLEKWLRNNPKDYWWNIVGGWEVFYRIK